MECLNGEGLQAGLFVFGFFLGTGALILCCGLARYFANKSN